MKDLILQESHSVGIIYSGSNPVGTAFVVGQGEILTNYHVVNSIASKDDGGIWTVDPPSIVVFDREYSVNGAKCSPEKTYSINGVFNYPSQLRDEGDDLAVLLTSVDDKYPSPLRFVKRPITAYRANMNVAVIGYPEEPQDMTVTEAMQFFRAPNTTGPVYGYKRISAGYTDVKDPGPGEFVHLANTTGGNSGSPVFDLSDGALVGVHSQGQSRFGNSMGYNVGIISDRGLERLKAAGLIQGATD